MQTLPERAEKLKSLATKHFNDGDNVKAHKIYTMALQIAPDNLSLLYKRSAVSLKMGRLEDALKDAERCMEVSVSLWPRTEYPVTDTFGT